MSALLAMVLVAAPLQVGTTLHPYFSWASAVTRGTDIVVRPVLPGDVDVGAYQPRPEDVAKLKDLDVLFVNGIGHDDFIRAMVKASGNQKCLVVNLNEGTALLEVRHGSGKNSHTFLSYGNAIAQSYVMARVLGTLRPELAKPLQDHASAYAKQLRLARADAVERLTHVRSHRVVTVHDGYGYLLQELGLELIDVVEPAHGLLPSAAELAHLLGELDHEPVKVVLAEEAFPRSLAQVLEQHGAKVVVVSHIATGAYTPERFVDEMKHSVDAVVAALQ